MDLQSRCDPQPPGAPQEDVTLLLSFLSVSTCLSCPFSSFVSDSCHPPPHLFGPQVPPACLHIFHPHLLLGLCAASPVTQRLSTLQGFSLLTPLLLSLSSPAAFLSLHLSWVCPSPFLWESPKAGSAGSHTFLGGRTPSAGAHEVYTFRCWSLGQPAQVSASCLHLASLLRPERKDTGFEARC